MNGTIHKMFIYRFYVSNKELYCKQEENNFTRAIKLVKYNNGVYKFNRVSQLFNETSIDALNTCAVLELNSDTNYMYLAVNIHAELKDGVSINNLLNPPTIKFAG
jgi:hypothetical protein